MVGQGSTGVGNGRGKCGETGGRGGIDEARKREEWIGGRER